MRFKVANYSRLEIRLDTLHIYKGTVYHICSIAKLHQNYKQGRVQASIFEGALAPPLSLPLSSPLSLSSHFIPFPLLPSPQSSASGSGSAVSSPSRSRQSLAAKRILVHFKPKLLHMVRINWLILVRKWNQRSSNYYYYYFLWKKPCSNISFLQKNCLATIKGGNCPRRDPPLL